VMQGGGQFFSGSMKDLVELTCLTFRTVKATSPNVLVVSPSFTGDDKAISRIGAFLREGGARCIDVLAFHSYEYNGTGPAHLVSMIGRIKALLVANNVASLPIWNTEFGLVVQNQEMEVLPLSKWGGLSVVHSRVHASQLATKYMVAGITAGLARFYWFAWDSRSMGLTLKSRQLPNDVGVSISSLMGWVKGAVGFECDSDWSSSQFSCRFRRDGRRYKLHWADFPFQPLKGEVVLNAYGQQFNAGASGRNVPAGFYLVKID
jgi:hypothetical protein